VANDNDISREGAEALLAQMASGAFPEGLASLLWSDKRPAIDVKDRAREAEARFRSLVEQIPAVTFMGVLGEGENEIYVSPHIEAMLGFTQAEWLEDPFLWYNQLHPDDRRLWNDEFTRGCQTGGPFRAECRFLSRDGKVVWVHGEARILRDDVGRPQFLQGVAFDITDAKRAQDVLVRDAVREAKREEELAIARRVQRSILPRRFEVPGLEIAAAMEPAEDVGGDYYDVLPAPHGAWLAMGDVSGHGLDAGLVMLMVQSAVATLTATLPEATPAQLIARTNAVLYDNVATRLESSDYVTLVLLRYDRGGRVVFSGAHEHVLVCRRDTGRVERIATPGPWMGIRRDVEHAAVDTVFHLRDGDVMVLFTDGLIEAQNARGEQLDMDRVCEVIERHRDEAPAAIQARLLEAAHGWMARQEDDISLLVARYSSERANEG
jgi:PAS domain S-box-containing protein